MCLDVDNYRTTLKRLQMRHNLKRWISYCRIYGSFRLTLHENSINHYNELTICQLYIKQFPVHHLCPSILKSLSMSNAAKKTSTVGEITSLMSVDCQRVQDAFMFSHFIVSLPFVTIGRCNPLSSSRFFYKHTVLRNAMHVTFSLQLWLTFLLLSTFLHFLKSFGNRL